MANSTIAYRYAKSLLELATEHNQVDAVYADMCKVLKYCQTTKEFTLLLQSPLIKTDKKINTFKALFKGEITATSDKFLILLAKNKRESYLEKIAQEFIDMYKVKMKISTVIITSAVKLDDATRERLLGILTNLLKNKIELQEKIDPKIIGGFVLTVGNRQADMSVLRQLKQLNKNFNQSYILN